jgi:hypothetical protein
MQGTYFQVQLTFSTIDKHTVARLTGASPRMVQEALTAHDPEWAVTQFSTIRVR